MGGTHRYQAPPWHRLWGNSHQRPGKKTPKKPKKTWHYLHHIVIRNTLIAYQGQHFKPFEKSSQSLVQQGYLHWWCISYIETKKSHLSNKQHSSRTQKETGTLGDRKILKKIPYIEFFPNWEKKSSNKNLAWQTNLLSFWWLQSIYCQ